MIKITTGTEEMAYTLKMRNKSSKTKEEKTPYLHFISEEGKIRGIFYSGFNTPYGVLSWKNDKREIKKIFKKKL